MTTSIEPERIRRLNEREPRGAGRYVLYWMQAAQRAEHNPALEFAIQRANDHGVPLVVAVVVIPDYPETSARHHAFMLGGLGRALTALQRRSIRVCLRVGDPIHCVSALSNDAVEVVFDRGYLRHQVRWYGEIARGVDVRVTQIEGEVVVPIDEVSHEAEYAARTIRPKINSLRDRYVVALEPTPVESDTTPQGTTSDIDVASLTDRTAVEGLLESLGVAPDPAAVDTFTPGTPAARSLLDDLLRRIESYDEDRNRYTDPESSSRLSPYLHFGQISPVAVASAAIDRAGDGAEAFLEELIIRRELAINFVARTKNYDSYEALPAWARESLADHRDDEREAIYTAAELEAGETHDEVWNTVMGAIRRDGWVHNQLRMYWGKQIVRWTNTPQHAFRTLTKLNNRYFLDGRDPSSHANVGWCFGLHDQGFKERPVTGKLRPFTTAALDRKDDLDTWLEDHAPADRVEQDG